MLSQKLLKHANSFKTSEVEIGTESCVWNPVVRNYKVLLRVYVAKKKSGPKVPLDF